MSNQLRLTLRHLQDDHSEILLLHGKPYDDKMSREGKVLHPRMDSEVVRKALPTPTSERVLNIGTGAAARHHYDSAGLHQHPPMPGTFLKSSQLKYPSSAPHVAIVLSAAEQLKLDWLIFNQWKRSQKRVKHRPLSATSTIVDHSSALFLTDESEKDQGTLNTLTQRDLQSRG